ncbi:circadian clock KaiB family protein [[Limnothrix rosea] IAM M-220]|uniref:circadian clock KaiB family protein n=1 Tax=[Limnothrix rosea] IAM M-220 TaxID=454133 RepID=UPI0009652CEB|nr:circadian clock KaiB family protein [[Limnothrix rosea] IAM M-220]OKH10889.1 circadian clock protein KaiB [[Limnothrix rosea] IAM M-220]
MSSDSHQGNAFNFGHSTEPQLQHHDEKEFYVLYLYVAGKTSNSRQAIKQLHKICNEYLAERHEIRIIDIYEHPDLAESDHIVATPTLIKKLPPPLRKLIGDLSDRESLLIGLDIW